MVKRELSGDAPTVRPAEGEADGAAVVSSAEIRPDRPLRLRPGNAQWIGARTEQQDAFAFDGCAVAGANPAGTVLVVLADGMGGLQAGREASRIAVSTFRASVAAQPAAVPVTDALDVALRAANQAVHELALTTAGEGEIGTTLVAAAVRESRLHWVSVGDSRLYLYSAANRSLTRCTEDHNFARELQEQVNAGELAADAVTDHPDRDALTSFLGLAEIPLVDFSRRPLTLQPGDRLLLCSDGVDGVLTLDELATPLAGDPQVAADALIAALRARRLAYQDNATVAVLACDSGVTPLPAAEPLLPPRRRSWTPVIAVTIAFVVAAVSLAWLGLAWWPDRAGSIQTADTAPPPVVKGDAVSPPSDASVPAAAIDPSPESSGDAGRGDGVPPQMPEQAPDQMPDQIEPQNGPRVPEQDAPRPVTPPVAVTPEPT
ncbi:protein phosphatase 2C domain-containing protein [Thiohalocapsa marina]|uniref:protein phosphatase 2C domain-containing protein n=1 Tax=Thiohalocapsa marina TaxID=424902 RepID=UPI0036DB0130